MNNFVNQPGTYYAKVADLTLKETVAVSVKLPPVIENSSLNILFSPFFIYGLIILFFVLFSGAIVIQIIQKVLTWKSSITTLIVVFVITAIPLTLKSALQYTSMQTKAAPDEVPKKVEINQVSTDSLKITWKTDSKKMGSVRIGPYPLNPQNSQTVIANSGKKSTQHEAQVSNLKPGIIYEIEILSGNNWYNQKGRPIKFELK